MDQTTKVLESFNIELNGKEYECKVVESGNEQLYFVNFNKTYLCLTPAVGASGDPFWATIPEDYKLKHIAQQIGDQIEKHYL